MIQGFLMGSDIFCDREGLVVFQDKTGLQIEEAEIL